MMDVDLLRLKELTHCDERTLMKFFSPQRSAMRPSARARIEEGLRRLEQEKKTARRSARAA